MTGLARPLGGRRTLAAATLAGATAAFLLYLISLRDYGADDGGPTLARLVRESYLADLFLANAKLAALLAAAGAVHGGIAGVVLVALEAVRERPTTLRRAILLGAASFALEAVRGFAAAFVESPGSVVALWPYDAARLHPLYDHLRPWMVDAVGVVLVLGISLVVLAALARLLGARARAGLASARAFDLRRLAFPSALEPVPATAIVLVAGAAGIVALRGAPRPPRTDPRPHVLVLLSDSLRADRVGAVRGGKPVTPKIDALAARGCTFTNCFVPVARTTESLVSMLTGSWPQSHGIRTSWVAPEQCRLRAPTLAGILGEAGYDTYGTGEWNSSDFGRFELGFERVEVPEETWNVRTMVSRGGRATAFLVRLFYANALGEWLAPEIYYYPGAYGSVAVTDRVTRQLARVARSGRPSLIVAFYAPTHAPFTARGDHLRTFTDFSYRGPNRYCLMARTIADAVSLQEEQTMRARDLEQVQGLYDAAVRTFDDHVGAVVARLSELGLAERTVVVVSSDHGTAFYERGSFGQGNEIASDVSNRVPLVVFDPRSPRRAAASHIVRSIDLTPTLCDLAGVAIPPTCEGRSLRPVLEDSARDLDLVAYAETGLWIGKQRWQSPDLDFGFPPIDEMLDVPDRRSGLIATKARWVQLMIRAQHRMVRDDRWKLLYVPTRTTPIIGLYDLSGSDDPPRDVAAEHPEEVKRLRRTLDSFLEREPPAAFRVEIPPPRPRSRK